VVGSSWTPRRRRARRVGPPSSRIRRRRRRSETPRGPSSPFVPPTTSAPLSLISAEHVPARTARLCQPLIANALMSQVIQRQVGTTKRSAQSALCRRRHNADYVCVSHALARSTVEHYAHRRRREFAPPVSTWQSTFVCSLTLWRLIRRANRTTGISRDRDTDCRDRVSDVKT
jgi:hypothetical protein